MSDIPTHTTVRSGATLAGGPGGNTAVEPLIKNHPKNMAKIALGVDRAFGTGTANGHAEKIQAYDTARQAVIDHCATPITDANKDTHPAELARLNTAAELAKTTAEKAHAELGERLETAAVVGHLLKNPEASEVHSTPGSLKDLEAAVAKANTHSKLAIGGAVTGVAAAAGGSMLLVHSKNKANAKKLAAEKQQAGRQMQGAKAQVDRLKQNVQEYQAALQELAQQQQRSAGSAAA